MSENTTQVSGSEVNGEVKEKRVVVQVIEYATKEECELNKPAGAEADAWKCYKVVAPWRTENKEVWIWAVGSVNAASTIARHDGCEVSLGGSRGPRTVSLAKAFTDEQIVAFAAMPDSMLAPFAFDAAVMARINAARPATNGNATPAATQSHKPTKRRGLATP